MSRLMPVVMIPLPDRLVQHEPTDGDSGRAAPLRRPHPGGSSGKPSLAAAKVRGSSGPGHTACRGWMHDWARPERIRMQVAALQALREGRARLQQFQRISRFGSDFDSIPRTSIPTTSHCGSRAVLPGCSHGKIMQIDDIQAPVSLRWGHVLREASGGNFVHPPTVLARRSLLIGRRGFDPRCAIAATTTFCWRVQGSPFCIPSPPRCLRYRRKPEADVGSRRHREAAARDCTILEKIGATTLDLELRPGAMTCARSPAEALLSAAYALAPHR